MESNGARTDPVSAESRHQVLRPGVRIVAQQFAPYDDGPDQADVDAELNSQWNRAFRQMTVYLRGHTFRGMTNSFRLVDEALKESMRVAEEAERKRREKMKKLEDAAVKALSNHASGATLDFVIHVDPAPNRYSSDHEPYYVKLTRPKKRR